MLLTDGFAIDPPLRIRVCRSVRLQGQKKAPEIADKRAENPEITHWEKSAKLFGALAAAL